MHKNIPMEATVALINLRDSRMHISGLMLLSIVDRICLRGDSGKAYIGEVEALYREHHVKGKTFKAINGQPLLDYTYNGISHMLRTLYKRNLLNRSSDGRYAMYSLSSKGRKVLDNLTL